MTNFHEDEIVLAKPDNFKQPSNDSEEKDEVSHPDIDFGQMQKIDEHSPQVYVTHNDLDLLDLQKVFVRKKNIKYNKIRTEEHSDDDFTSSSSDHDVDVVIPQGW